MALTGVSINSTNTLTTYGLFLCADLKIGEPKLKENRVDIPGGDGSLNMSYSPQGMAVYYDREISFTLAKAMDEATRDTLVSTLRNLWHGKEVDLILPNDTTHFWHGVLSIGDVSGYNKALIPVKMTAQPYKYAIDETTVVWNATDYITDDIAALETEGVFPFSSIVCDINSAQDLHGYSNPWPAGGGKNKCPLPTAGTQNGVTLAVNADGTITLTGTSSAITYFDLDTDFDTTAYAGYILNGYPSSFVGNTTSIVFRICASTSDRASIQDIQSNMTGVVNDNGSHLCLAIRITNNYAIPSGGLVFKPMLRASTDSATFAPYENICPLTGHTGLDVYRTGKNLLNQASNIAGSIVRSNGGELTGQDQNYGRTVFIRVSPNTTYTWSGLGNVISIVGKRGGEYTSADFSSFVQSIDGASSTSGSFTTSATTNYVCLNVVTAGASQQLEVGSSASTYEAYSGNTYSVAWPEIGKNAVEASQDLHGYSNPWPAGGGKNLLPMTLANLKTWNVAGTWSGDTYTYQAVTFAVATDNGGNVTSITVNGTASGYCLFYCSKALTFTADTKLNGCPSGGSGSGYRIQAEGGTTRQDLGSGVTIPANEAKTRVIIVVNQSTAVSSKVFYPMLRYSSVTDASFAPYTNISPITPVTLTRDDNSTLDIYGGTVKGVFNSSGELTGGLLTVTHKDVDLGAQTWTKSATGATGEYRFTWQASPAAKGPSATTVKANAICSAYKTITAETTWDASDIGFGIGTTGYVLIHDPAYNGSTEAQFKTAMLGVKLVYELATAITYNLSVAELKRLLTAINASAVVYAGTLDVSTGKLTVTAQGTSVHGGFVAASNGTFYKEEVFSLPAPSTASVFESSYFETYKTNASGGTAQAILNPEKLHFQIIGTNVRIMVKTTAYASVSDFNTALSTKPLDIVLSLATPLVYYLTPTQIASLVGENRLWHDANGEISVVIPFANIANERKNVVPRVTNPAAATFTLEGQAIAVSAGTDQLIPQLILPSGNSQLGVKSSANVTLKFRGASL